MPEDTPSWSEAERHRMTMARLAELISVVEKLSDKIGTMSDKNEDSRRTLDGEVTNLKVKVAMLEVSTKIWSSLIGLVGGAISFGISHMLIDKH